uniref:Uncharacterized protein n=1 Tax=Anguilla anguilla TaxID=7936 RepID=A0A0E9Y0E7_ANGAN
MKYSPYKTTLSEYDKWGMLCQLVTWQMGCAAISAVIPLCNMFIFC